MTNDNKLDLSLSLPCGGPSAGSKGKNITNPDESDRGSKIIDDFKSFLDGSNHKEDTKPDENLFYDLSKGPTNNVQEGGKRKNMFEEINNQKRHEKDVYSSTENEDVAESEAGNEEVRVVSHSSDVDIVQSQRKLTISSEKEFKVGFSGQSGNIVVGSASNDRSGTQQPVIPANLPLMFGKSEGMSHSLQYHPPYFGRPSPSSNMQNNGLKINQAATPVNALNSFERVTNDSKHTKEELPSLQTEADTKGTNVIDQSKTDICPPEHPSIRPGISAEVKFGGSGSSPNLPWVSTTGSGPNGKTISGVTYRFSGTQIRIVCACHGSHMSPEEFVQHANEEQPNGLPSFSNSNPSASAQN